MKIAILGGGFYGTFLAYRLGKEHEVTLYEQASELMNRSAIFNQCRLHAGFHYPRCPTTIAQTNEGYPRFVAEFAPFLRDIERNVYAIRRDGKSRYADLKANLSGYPVRYRETAAPAILKNPEEYEAFLQVEEKLILLDRLKAHLVGALRAKIVVGAEVVEVSHSRGIVALRDRSEFKFDRIINATFTNPNLGLPLEEGFHFSYELAAMVCLESNSVGAEAITIIDGEFVSLYPNYEGQDTLSSVRYTPFARPSNRIELEEMWARRNEICKTEKVMEKIITDARDYLELGTVRNAHLWIAPKVKLRGNPFSGAPSEVRAHGKVISVFCGKLDSIYSVLDAVEARLGK